MDVKRKIMAISIMVLFLALPLNIAEAEEITTTQESEPYVLEIVTVDQNGFFTTEEITFFEEDFEEFENAITTIMDQIESTANFDWGFLRNLIEKILGADNPLFGTILKLFSILKLSKNRGFVISSGHGYDFNPMNKFSFKIRKKAATWYYNSKGLFKDRTIIVKPFALKMKILTGRQVGFMHKFFGVYFFVSKGFLKETYTFFLGTALHINGIQFGNFNP